MTTTPSPAAPPSDPATAWLDDLRASERASKLTTFTAAAGDVLFREGEPGRTFLVVTEGDAEVRKGTDLLAVVGKGSVLGELSLLTGERRSTTVIACTAMTGYAGTVEDFDALLTVPPIRERFLRLAATRLATNIDPVPFVAAKSGFEGLLRPLLPGDRADYLDMLQRFGAESRRLRFFSSATPSPALIEYLLGIDYLNHFAWIVLDTSHPDHAGAAVARFVRAVDEPHEAEVAFAVSDEHHGKGLGTLLLGALGVTADEVGITTFTAEVLDENSGMRRVFDRIGAHWTRADRGVLAARMEVARARALLDPGLDAQLQAAVHGIGLAASGALEL